MDPLSRNENEFQEFPEVLRMLVEEELAAGNQILEIGHGFPAAPCGAYIKLARAVSTRERAKTSELHFFDRDSSQYSGEFTDAKRHFFVLEPPHPYTPPPDMDTIRASLNAQNASSVFTQGKKGQTGAPNRDEIGLPNVRSSTVADFAKSMEITYDKWKEGEGYDLKLIENADEPTRKAIEDIVLRQVPRGWRDIEALAAIDSSRGRAAIQEAFLTADTETRMAIHRYAPELINERQRIDSIVQSLNESAIFTGLSQTLNEVEDFHPPEIVQALLSGLWKRDGAIACHFAAMLYFLHGKSTCAFDWNHRPFFLRFNTENLEERKTAIRELYETIGLDTKLHGL